MSKHTQGEREHAANERYNTLIANCKAKQIDTNPNVIRDLIASYLKRKGLFRSYDTAVRYSTDFVAMRYDPGKRTQEQELAQ